MLQQILCIMLLLLGIYVLNIYFSGTSYNQIKPNLWNKYAIITGGNTGIGKQIAKDLAQQGCKVIVAARDQFKSKNFVSTINKQLGQQMLSYEQLDLGNVDSIKSFVGKIQKQDHIDFLINNAGVMGLPERTLTKSGHEMHYGINYLGHFLLTYLLWNKLNKSKFFRIINTSSITHKRQLGFFKITTLDFNNMDFQSTKYSSVLAYSRSKLYNNLFTHALAQKIPKGKGIAVSVHPGVVRTEIFRYMFIGWFNILMKIINPLYAIFTKSPKQGAQTTLSVLYLPPEQLINGAYYADCCKSTQNNLVTQKNWNQLWRISERQLNIEFKQ